MQIYLRAVQSNLQKELLPGSVSRALRSLLDENDWWLRSIHAKKVCSLIDIEFSESAYYRDIFVWLPDVRWGNYSMPPCPNCCSSKNVKNHGWRDNHIGRRIVALNTNYFALSRRYKCVVCEGVALLARTAAKERAELLDCK